MEMSCKSPFRGQTVQNVEAISYMCRNVPNVDANLGAVTYQSSNASGILSFKISKQGCHQRVQQRSYDADRDSQLKILFWLVPSPNLVQKIYGRSDSYHKLMNNLNMLWLLIIIQSIMPHK